MTKVSTLAAVAHNIAHHSSSGLSYISPHLAQALRAVGECKTEIDLLAKDPYPPRAAELQPLRLALASLHKTVKSLLIKHGFSENDVSSIMLYATPAPWDQDGYLLHTRTIIISSTGRTFDSGWIQ